jgi:hypothetical protein
MNKRLLRFLGLITLAAAVMGSKCTPDRDIEPVITVDIVARFVADGSENQYTADTTIVLSDEVDLPSLMEENGIDEIRDITVESVFYRITLGDAGAQDRTVSDNVLTVAEGQGAPAGLFTINSVAVNDPQFADWTPIPMNAAGVALLNSALDKLRLGQHTELSFAVSGTSSPTNIRTHFKWEAKVRIKLVGVRKIKVFEPL